MPSERRRQRQQRIRHEAGEDDGSTCFSSAPTEEAKQPVVPSEISQTLPSGSIASQTPNEEQYRKFDVPSNDQRPQSNQHLDRKGDNYQRDTRRNNQFEGNRGQNYERRDQNYRGRGNFNQRGNWRDPRGRGYRHSQGLLPTPVINSNVTNVALAEEAQYESVSIMPATSPAPKEEPTVVSKYRRREVISNWLQYDEIPSEDEENDGEDYLCGEDFSEVLKQSASSGSSGYLHLKGERTWGDVDTSYLGSHGLGALKVAELVSALQTIPLHTLLDIPTKKLPSHAISNYTNFAEDNLKLYKPNAEYVTDIEVNEKMIESLKITSDTLELSPSEDVDTEVKNPIDATLKFSSAFAPEADDVDLDEIMRERTPEESVREISPPKPQVPKEEKKDNSKTKKIKQPPKTNEPLEKPKPVDRQDSAQSSGPGSRQPSEEKEAKSFNFQLPKSEPAKKEFSFGLSNSQASKKVELKPDEIEIDGEKQQQQQHDEKSNEVPAIDLEAPILEKDKKPVLLITKTETENLEDWLDSVLDD